MATTKTKTDIIRTWEGRLILPFGSPYIISTAWETATHYHTDAVCFLDCLDQTVDVSLHYQSFAKSHAGGLLPGSMTNVQAMKYCVEYGYSMAFRHIPTMLWNYGYKNLYKKQNWPDPNTLEIILAEKKDYQLVVLTHLLRKDKKAFNWIEEHTQSAILKALMKMAKGLNIQSTQIYKP